MASTFERFRAQLDSAIDTIEKFENLEKKKLDIPTLPETYADAQSLLDRCESVSNKYKSAKPKIRIIHHLACSGGSLISKCISSMPNVYLLSEVHPYADRQRKQRQQPLFSPQDIVSLADYAGVPMHKSLSEKIFLASIKSLHEHVDLYGGYVVIRSHSHTDYCSGEAINSSPIVKILADFFDVQSVATLRNPIDSYLSLKKNNWLHFTPSTFDEYCRRVGFFIEEFGVENILTYDSFIVDPLLKMDTICEKLEIPFSDSFLDIFDAFKVTGDSGRKSDRIEAKSRRPMSETFIKEISNSKNFESICNKINVDWNDSLNYL